MTPGVVDHIIPGWLSGTGSPAWGGGTIGDIPWWALAYLIALGILGLATTVEDVRRSGAWWVVLGQLVATTGLMAFVAGHWVMPVRYALGRWSLLLFLFTFVWEMFALALRLARLLPPADAPERYPAGLPEVLWLVGRAAVLAPAMLFGGALAYRIWF